MLPATLVALISTFEKSCCCAATGRARPANRQKTAAAWIFPWRMVVLLLERTLARTLRPGAQQLGFAQGGRAHEGRCTMPRAQSGLASILWRLCQWPARRPFPLT